MLHAGIITASRASELCGDLGSTAGEIKDLTEDLVLVSECQAEKLSPQLHRFILHETYRRNASVHQSTHIICACYLDVKHILWIDQETTWYDRSVDVHNHACMRPAMSLVC